MYKKIILSILLVFLLFLFGCNKNTNQEKTYSQKLYEQKSSYVGNNSQVLKLLNELNLNIFGTYKIELQTLSEPYGLKIIYDKFQENLDLAEFESYLESNSILLLSLIKNLSYVEWHYNQETKKISIEEANEIIGKNVKEFSESEKDLQGLIDTLNISKLIK